MRALLTPASDHDLAARIRRRLTRDRADLVAFASELIAIPSENPPGDHYPRCANVIARWLRDLGLKVRAMNPSKPDDRRQT